MCAFFCVSFILSFHLYSFSNVASSLSLIAMIASTRASRVWSFGMFGLVLVCEFPNATRNNFHRKICTKLLFFFRFRLTLLLFVSLSLSLLIAMWYLTGCSIETLKYWTILSIDTLAFALNSCVLLTLPVFAVVADEIFHIGLVICCLQGRFTDLFGNFSCVRQLF